MKTISVMLADLPVEIVFRYETYLPYFEAYRTNETPRTRVSLSRDELARRYPLYGNPPSAAYVEESELCRKTGDALLPFDRAIFHAAAFLWRGKAWLLTAPSGIGKTTQLMHWKRLCGADLCVISGDKPVLEFAPEQTIVHPSPWNGKENYGGDRSAPLGGIVLLRQGAANAMQQLSPHDSAGRLYLQFMHSADTTQQVMDVCRLEDRMLRAIKVWELFNRGDADSAKLCRDTLIKEAFG